MDENDYSKDLKFPHSSPWMNPGAFCGWFGNKPSGKTTQKNLVFKINFFLYSSAIKNNT